MTEKELRDMEKLRTTDDYKEEIRSLSEVVCNVKKADKKIDETLLLLTNALNEKYKYIIKQSKPYRKKQGFFSMLRDWLATRREQKQNKEPSKPAEEPKKEEQPVQPKQVNNQQIEYLDKDGTTKLLGQGDTSPSPALAEGDKSDCEH